MNNNQRLFNLKDKFSGLFSTEGTLSQKAARGGVWVFGSFLFSKILFFIRTIILVRLLTPEDFGLMGICYIAIGGMAVFTETGFNTALIQRKEHSDDTLNTAWVISVLRGVVLFLLLFFLSPLVASFYNNSQIEPILKVIAFSFLFSGFMNIGLILYAKELNFKKRVYYEQITNITAIVLTVALAFILRNIWALVLGHIAGALVGMIVSYQIHDFRPKFRFKPDIAKELFHFGKYIFLSGVIIFLLTQGDDALLGKVLGLSALGFYVLAYNLSNMPATSITHVISRVSFPAYSKVQDDISRLRKAYKRVLGFTSILSIPLAAGLFILAPELIRIVYGEKWLPMVPAMQVLCLFGIFRSIGATLGPVVLAVGKPRIQTLMSIVQLIVMAIIIYPLTKKYNIFGTSIATTIPLMIGVVMYFTKVKKILDEKMLHLIKPLVNPLIGSLMFMLIIYVIKKYVFLKIELFQLTILILLGCVIYFAFLIFIEKNSVKEALNIIKSM